MIKFDQDDLGRLLLERPSDMTICERADRIFDGYQPQPRRFKPTGMLGAETAIKYQAELQRRAVKGDRFAISVLMTGEPGDSSE